MKKFLLFLSFCCLSLTFFSCGKSYNVSLHYFDASNKEQIAKISYNKDTGYLTADSITRVGKIMAGSDESIPSTVTVNGTTVGIAGLATKTDTSVKYESALTAAPNAAGYSQISELDQAKIIAGTKSVNGYSDWYLLYSKGE